MSSEDKEDDALSSEDVDDDVLSSEDEDDDVLSNILHIRSLDVPDKMHSMPG